MAVNKRLNACTKAVFSLVSCLALSFAPSFAQGEEASAKKKTFALSAVVVDKPQLSRTEIDPMALGMGMASMPPGAGLPLPQMPAKSSRPAPSTNSQGQSPRTLDSSSSSSLAEYNVDWSGWVSRFADRWFYLLRSAEYEIGVQFQTARPALIQFTCYADGTIGNVCLKQSSGVAAYDRLQVQTLLLSMPLAPFPSGTRRKAITLVQGWESHRRQPGEEDFQPGSFGRGFPQEKVSKCVAER